MVHSKNCSVLCAIMQSRKSSFLHPAETMPVGSDTTHGICLMEELYVNGETN